MLPVSAKEALKAKLGGSSLAPSGFGDLEDYVLSFLGGGGKGDTSGKSGSRSGEGLRLKLGTPLQVGTLLFDAAEDILSGEREAASAEVAAATGVEAAMQSYRRAMEADFAAQRDAMRGCVLRATSRCDDLLDSTLRLTNGANLFATYILGNGRGVGLWALVLTLPFGVRVDAGAGASLSVCEYLFMHAPLPTFSFTLFFMT